MKEKEIKELLRAVKNFRAELREKGNSDYDRVSNKDVLFYFLSKFEGLERRVTKTETRQKMFLGLIPIAVAIVLALGKL